MIPITFIGNKLSLLLSLTFFIVFVVNPVIPARFRTDDNRVVRNVNLAYEEWEVQDQILLSRLELTLTKSILSCVLGTVH